MSDKNYYKDLEKGLEILELEERLEMVQVSVAEAAAESSILDCEDIPFTGGDRTYDLIPPV